MGLWAFHLLVAGAGAHQASDAFLELSVGGERVEVRWWVALRDLEAEVGLDQNGDGAITWGELAGREAELAGRMGSWVRLEVDGAGWASPAPRPLQVDEREDGSYAVLGVEGPRPRDGARLSLEYGFLFASDPGHRVHVRVLQEGGEAQALLDPGNRTAEWTVAGVGAAERVAGAAWAAPGRAVLGGAGPVLAAGVARAGRERGWLAVLALSLGFWLGVGLAVSGCLAARPTAEAWALGLAVLAYLAEAARPWMGAPARTRLAVAAGMVWGVAAGPGLAAVAGASGAGWAGAILGTEALVLGSGALAVLAARQAPDPEP